jgi:hypothetical protein
MPRDPFRRKVTVRQGGQTLVLLKRPEESGEHVMQKALLWALYRPTYPELRVEQRLPWPSRYKPDLYALDPTAQRAVFWGECGMVGVAKLRDLLRRLPATHFAFSKWATGAHAFAALIEDAIAGLARTAPVELVEFPEEAAGWFAEGRELVVPPDAIATWRWPGAKADARPADRRAARQR